METTLGKRIAAGRKRMKLTQDQLAEQLGVTAQAVSKWENDQSCPDITMLPKLAEIFGTTTDALLGMEEEPARTAEPVQTCGSELEENGIRYENGKMEFRWDGGRRGSLGFALWVLLTGVLTVVNFMRSGFSFWWDISWPSALLMFGLFGLYPKFSIWRLGCALFGGYCLVDYYWDFSFNSRILLPILLVLLGLSLLFEALRKPGKPHFSISHKSSDDARLNSTFTCEGERFDCSNSFGEAERRITLPRLSGGRAAVSFGELTVDLTRCEEFAPDCRLDLSCSFGELEILVPRTCRAKHNAKSAFASVEVKGEPSDDAADEIYLNCDVSFGEICIRYI